MLHVKVKKRQVLLIVLAVVLLVFSSAFGAVEYHGQQALAQQQSDTDALMARYDKQIAELKAKALAKKKAEEAAKKAAEQTSEAEKALAAQQAGQVVTPAGCAISGAHGDPNSIDVVVNKKRCFNPVDFVPPDLTSYGGYVVSAKLLTDLTAMFDAAAAAGVPLSMTSSYRSYANQVATYNHWVSVNGSTASADKVSARPGYSEHQTGLAIDLSAGGCSLECFRGSAQYQWMLANATNYGFIERYPAGYEATTGYSPEAWHWRYIGPTSARAMQASGVKTLEQYWNLAGGDY